MYKKILIPVAPDHLEAVSDSIVAARVLADEGATMHVLSVIDVIPEYVVAEVGGEVCERSCARAKAEVGEALVDIDDIEIEATIGEPPSKIIETARDGGFDLIVIRSHKPGIRDWFLGSTAGRVLRSVPCAVHVLR